jgi:flavin reductase (DIM6/NTAB) family NADH-FMN oxidoreductase RutF/rubredoxin
MDLNALFKVSYGLYVIGAGKDNDLNGQIANSVMQVTADPVQVTICINTKNLTHEFIQKYQSFSISVLEETTPMEVIGDFGFKSGRDFNKFANQPFIQNKTGAPILTDHTVSWMEARVISETLVSTHTLFVGEVVDAKMLTDTDPMTYAYYHQVKGGASPKNAPTYNEELNRASNKAKQDTCRCGICGYIFDPAIGDATNNISPGTLFEDLPNDWVCPICKATQDKFVCGE